MPYTPPIRGIIKKPIKSVYPSVNLDLYKEINRTTILANQMESLQEDIANTVDEALGEVGVALEKISLKEDQIEETFNSKIEEIDTTLNDFTEKATELIDELNTKEGLQGEPGLDADEEKIKKEVLSEIRNELNKESIVKEVLLSIPKTEPLDEKKLMEKLLKKLPESKASLKVIQEKIEIDPMSVIDQIMALPEGKFKLKTSQIDGLEQTVSSLRNQLSRGYLHGGGDTLVAGNNITITPNANGTKTVASTGGGSSGYAVVNASTTPLTATAVSGEVFYNLDTTTTNITITLPNAVGNNAKFVIKKKDLTANTITVLSAGGTIDGIASFVISAGNWANTFYSDNQNWYVV